ncbi:Transferrin receptor-like, ESAG6-like [Trypanosoma congolense IL3000]|uniref:Transferrin receptor-like, ESAG6-like n=1 Tax=Trypanosoma congolense (strain IL3000) TaxID=1068625 RepID=F9WG13_TRYCI|nr:Transferrin receptor-like, ESAG6-like [Trypanosoma congolense IL3000]
MLQAMKALGLILMMPAFFSEVSCASFYYPKAVPTEAGGSICSLSRKLKDISPWTQGQLEALKKTRDAYASKLLDWQLHFDGSHECEVNQSILETIRTDLEKVNEEIKKLPAKAIRAGGFAAKSAGRFDEFITVFANAQKTVSFLSEKPTDRNNYCLGGGGGPAKRRNLFDCFPEGGKIEMGENNLAKIPESVPHQEEPNLTDAIENINHSALAGYVKRYDGDDHADCNLINGKAGILSGALNDKLWWGGGILTIGKSFEGELKKESLITGGIQDAKDEKALWTASPHTIPHLKKTLAAFHDFKDSAAKITQKLDEIGKIESQIEPCLSNETMEQGPTQSCFQNAVKLNAELKATNALLARYHKEKGPLTSGSASILHPNVMSLLCLIAALA